jgi:transcriptional regulator with XRE-family HTH domain
VPTSPSSSVQQAREALGQRLREVRAEAGLSARDLGRLMERHPSKISRIEHGKAMPSAADIQTWCAFCHAEDQAPDLIASLQSLESAYVEWRRLERTGMRRLQESYLPLYERTWLFRIYEPGVIPGLFQTPAYATARMSRIAEFSEVTNDVEQAVTARMNRQRVLYSGNHRFAVVLEEWALRCRIGAAEMMAGQLGHLISMGSLPSVSLGIIPMNIDRAMWSSPGFWIFDDERVLLETPTAELTVTQPREISIYARTFTELNSLAVVGSAARSLITAAINALGDDSQK